MNDKFVYIHKKPCGEVFYVGAGSKHRPYQKWGRCKDWNIIVEEFGYEVEIVKSNLNIQEAIILEEELISKYGRLINNSGTLVNNKTKGTVYNRTFSKEHGDKIAEAQTGNKNHRFGKKGIECNVSKQIINIVTGETWNTIMECAKDLNVNYSHLSEQLNNRVTNTTNLRKIKK